MKDLSCNRGLELLRIKSRRVAAINNKGLLIAQHRGSFLICLQSFCSPFRLMGGGTDVKRDTVNNEGRNSRTTGR
jgi:hypothetical protein